MFKQLLFDKKCSICKITLQLDVCLCCNRFINICKCCINNIVIDLFSNVDYNSLILPMENILNFSRLLSSSEPNIFCKNCIVTGLYDFNINESEKITDNIIIRIRYLTKMKIKFK
jgi:hypothetical protein